MLLNIPFFHIAPCNYFGKTTDDWRSFRLNLMLGLGLNKPPIPDHLLRRALNASTREKVHSLQTSDFTSRVHVPDSFLSTQPNSTLPKADPGRTNIETRKVMTIAG